MAVGVVSVFSAGAPSMDSVAAVVVLEDEVVTNVLEEEDVEEDVEECGAFGSSSAKPSYVVVTAAIGSAGCNDSHEDGAGGFSGHLSLGYMFFSPLGAGASNVSIPSTKSQVCAGSGVRWQQYQIFLS